MTRSRWLALALARTAALSAAALASLAGVPRGAAFQPLQDMGSGL